MFLVAWVEWKADTVTELPFEVEVPVRGLDFGFLVVEDSRLGKTVDFFVLPDSTEIETLSFCLLLVGLERAVLYPDYY